MPKKPEVSNQGHAAVHTGNSKFERQRQLISSFERIETKRQKSERQQDDRTKTERGVANRTWTTGIENITADLEHCEVEYMETGAALLSIGDLSISFPKFDAISLSTPQANDAGVVPGDQLGDLADQCSDISETIAGQLENYTALKSRHRKLRMTSVLIGVYFLVVVTLSLTWEDATLMEILLISLVISVPLLLIFLPFIWDPR